MYYITSFIQDYVQGRQDLAEKLRGLRERCTERDQKAKGKGCEQEDEAMGYNAGDRQTIGCEIKQDQELQKAVEDFNQRERDKLAGQLKKIRP